MLQGSKISYRGKNYRVQDAGGWKHIIITDKGKRQRVGVSYINKPDDNDYVDNYVSRGGFENYPCPAMDYWIYRHRLGRRISPDQYKLKFKIKLKNYVNSQ